MLEYKRTIELKILGGLECLAEGKRLEFVYNAGTKMSQLMLLLLYNAHNGTPKNQIYDSLYRDSDADASNSLKTLFTRLRTALSKALDLPGTECLTLKNGFYDIAPEIRVLCDAEEFKSLAAEGIEEENLKKRTGLLSKACGEYGGEMLPMLSAEYWVILENALLENLYKSSVRELCSAYDEADDFESAYGCYKRARIFFPYEEEWIIGGIEELLSMGKNSQALAEYEEVTQTVFDELGEYPSERLLETLRSVSKSLAVSINTADSTAIASGKEHIGGAYYCTYPNFSGTSHVLRCIMKRDNIPSCILLMTVENKSGKELSESSEIAPAISLLHIAVGKTLRATDLFTRYSAAQLLVMLWNTPVEKADVVIGRISSRLKQEDPTGKYRLVSEVFSGEEAAIPRRERKKAPIKQWKPLP